MFFFFKFRYEMLRVHAFGSDLSRYDTICLFHVIQYVTIESPDQTKSSAFGYDNPNRVQTYHDRRARFGTMLYAHIRYNTFITMNAILVSRLLRSH